jgi:hypothetical protein
MMASRITYPQLIVGHTKHLQLPVLVDPERSYPHRLLIGGTGKGKTSMLRGLIAQQIHRGGGFIFVDGKCDPENIATVVHLCQLTDRWPLLRVIAPGMPWSHTFNPLYNAREIGGAVHFLMSLLPPVSAQSDAQYYRDLVQQFLLKTLEIFRATGKTATVRDLLALMTGDMKVAEEKLTHDLMDLRQLEHLASLSSMLRQFTTRDGNALSGLAAQIQSLLSTDTGRFMTTVYSDVDLRAAIDLNMPVYIGLPTSGDPSRANALGRGFLADISATMADVIAERSRTPQPPFLVILDEFGSYVTAQFADVFRKARGSGIQVVACVTNIADLTDETKGVPHDYPEQLVGNARVIFMGSESVATLRYAEAYFGDEKQWIESRRESRGASASERRWGLARVLNPVQVASHTVFDQATERREPKFEKEVLHRLGKGEGVLFFRGEPTLVQLISYLPPDDAKYMDLATAIPKFNPRSMEPLALAEYLNVRAIQTRLAQHEKADAQEQRAAASSAPHGKRRQSTPQAKPGASAAPSRRPPRTPSTLAATAQRSHPPPATEKQPPSSVPPLPKPDWSS